MSTEVHDEMVKRVVRKLEQRFYRDIQDNAQGMNMNAPNAAQLEDATLLPDITVGRHDDLRYLIEVEVEETLSDKNNLKRWLEVAKLAERSQSEFWIAVPKGLGWAVEEKLNGLGASAKIWEI